MTQDREILCLIHQTFATTSATSFWLKKKTKQNLVLPGCMQVIVNLLHWVLLTLLYVACSIQRCQRHRSSVEQTERAGPKQQQLRAGEGLPVAMALGWPGVLCHLPALFGPSYYQNHQKLSKQARLQIPPTAASPAWYSRGHQVWTPVAVVTGPPRPWVLSEPIPEGKVCFLSLLAVNLECLTLHLRRAQNAASMDSPSS